MQAAWYEAQGAAHDVLVVGLMPGPHPGPGEVRVRVLASGINPGDLEKRQDAFRLGMGLWSAQPAAARGTRRADRVA